MPVFNASTQYGDWSGIAQADDADLKDVKKKLREEGRLEEGDFVIGIRVHMGEHHHNEPTPPIWTQFLVVQAKDYESAKTFLESPDPIRGVKEIKVDWSLEEFFRCFKRFSIALP